MDRRRTSAAVSAGLLTLLATSGVAAAAPSDGRTIYGVTSNGNRLVRFPANNPGAATAVVLANQGSILGLITPDERVVGIDFRPSTGVLYALTIGQVTGTGNSQTGTGRLYTIDKATAVATFVSTVTTPLSGAYYDIGFNPVSDALRIVSSNGQNLRVPSANGFSTTIADTALTYPSGDRNGGQSPKVAGIDYTPANGNATTLYDIDYVVDSLSVQGSPGGTPNSPNGGVLTTVGSSGLGVNVNNLLGFDFEVDGTGYATAQTLDPDTGGSSPGTTLFTVNTGTGMLTKIGDVRGDLLDSIAIDTATPNVNPVLPEFGVAALAPVAALGLAGSVVVLRRRRPAPRD